MTKKEYKSQWYQKNKERILGHHKEYRLDNLEQIKNRKKLYYENNKDEILRKIKDHYHKKLKNDISYKMGRKDYHDKYYLENKNEVTRKHREYDRKHRTECIDHYGGKCACCGENTYEFLSIDHINGNGLKHRREVGDIVRWLIKNNYPEGFRILCHNCNQALGHYGYCPHSKESKETRDEAVV